MILENKKGAKKEFKILFEFENKDSKYVIYEDPTTNNVFGGKINKDKLESLNSDEYMYINKILDKIEGVNK